MIYVDADSCPVKDIILDIAKKYQIEVIMYFDQSHEYTSSYATIKIVESGKDSVDMYIINSIKEHDIVVSQDYGLLALALSKKALAITPNGIIMTNDNIDSFLETRYLGGLDRRKDKHIKGPKKRTKENDESFKVAFEKLIQV